MRHPFMAPRYPPSPGTEPQRFSSRPPVTWHSTYGASGGSSYSYPYPYPYPYLYPYPYP